MTFFVNLGLNSMAGMEASSTIKKWRHKHLPSLCLLSHSDVGYSQIYQLENTSQPPALPGKQVLAADTQSSLVVLGHTHLVRAALYLQAGVFGWVQGWGKKNKKRVVRVTRKKLISISTQIDKWEVNRPCVCTLLCFLRLVEIAVKTQTRGILCLLTMFFFSIRTVIPLCRGEFQYLRLQWELLLKSFRIFYAPRTKSYFSPFGYLSAIAFYDFICA